MLFSAANSFLIAGLPADVVDQVEQASDLAEGASQAEKVDYVNVAIQVRIAKPGELVGPNPCVIRHGMRLAIDVRFATGFSPDRTAEAALSLIAPKCPAADIRAV